MSFTINSTKDTATPRKPILLCELTFSDAAVLRLATVACAYNGNAYEPALIEQNLERLAFLSEQGVDRIPAASVQIADPDGTIYTAWERAEGKGFRGATMVIRFALYDLVTAEWSTDSIIPFIGVCEQPSVDGQGMTVQAQAALNLAALQLPIWPMGPRCPKINPATTQQRAEASDSNSRFYPCGETRDLGAAPPCSYTRQTCTQPDRFAGCTWQAAKQGEGREYITGDKIAWTNPDTSGRSRTYWPQWLGGACWIEAPVINQWADGNYTRGEVGVGVGVIDVLKVVVNGIELTQGASGDFRWHYVNHGTRDGAHNTDVGYADGDPYGSLTAIQVLAPHSVIDPNSLMSVRILGRKATASANIPVVSAASGGTGPIRVEFGRVMSTYDPGDGTLVTIAGNSWAAANGSFILRYLDLPYDHAYLEGTQASGSGTGGTLYYASSTLGSGGAVPTPWVIQEALKASGRFSDASFGTSWAPAAALCEHPIEYTDGDGNVTSQMRFSSAMALVERRSVADIARGLRSSIGARVYSASNGKLEISVEGPLAEQQSAPVDGSNYNTAISSTLRDGTTANGYVAYDFNDSNSGPVKRTAASGNSTTPNVVSFPFSDPAADWAVSTFSEVDPEDVSRMDQVSPGGLQVQPEGVASYNHAYRIARLGLAKVLRGNPSGDTRGTDWFEWPSSFRACRVQPGHIVRLADPVLLPTPLLVRVTGIRAGKNFESLTFTGHHHEDSWYQDTPATLANPERTFYHYTPPTGTDSSTRLVTESGDQLPSDNLVLFDTTGIEGFTTTLTAAITDTTTTLFTVADGANLRAGIYVQIGSERIGPIVGSGTAWGGPRAALGTEAATHLNGATVEIGGPLTFNLLKISEYPDRTLLLRKSTTDINYVVVVAAEDTPVDDTFPDGNTEFLLPSNLTDEGTSSLRSPGGTSREWIILAGAGRSGPPGPQGETGPSGAGDPAGNVTIDSVEVDPKPAAASSARGSRYATGPKRGVTIQYTPPNPLGTFREVWVEIEAPDQSQGEAAPSAADTVSVADAVTLTGPKHPYTFGPFSHEVAQGAVRVEIPEPDGAALPMGARARVRSASYAIINDADGSPSQIFVIPDPAPAKPDSGTAYGPNPVRVLIPATVPGSGVRGAAQANPYRTTASGVDETHLWVTIDLDARSAGYQLVLVNPSGDHLSASGIETSPHFELVFNTPGSVGTYTVFAPGSDGVSVNPIVDGITPSATVTLGTADGTVDLGQVVESSLKSQHLRLTDGGQLEIAGVPLGDKIATDIAAYLDVESGVLKVKPSALTGDLVAAAAIDTIHLVDEAVGANQIAPFAVTAAKIGNAVMQNAHFDRATANKIAIVDADIVSLAAAKINAGTLGAGVIYAGTIAANKITAGTLAADVIYGGNIAADKISAGTISAAITLTAPTINVNSGGVQIQLDTSNYILITNGTSTRTRHHYSYFQVEQPSDPNRYSQMAIGAVTVATGAGTGVLGAGYVLINGVQVVGPRYGVRPITLNDVIALLVAHGLCI